MGSLLWFWDKIPEHVLKTPQVTCTQKFKTMPSSGKVTASMFWDSEGIIMINYQQKGYIKTGAYYTSQLCKLGKEIKRRWGGQLWKGVCLVQDNSAAHTLKVAGSATTDLDFRNLLHPPYLSDLAPWDFFCSQNWSLNSVKGNLTLMTMFLKHFRAFWRGVTNSGIRRG